MGAFRLAPHLSHKSTLALIPPSNLTAPIEALRRVHDKHFARWPPHINLIYPFLVSPSEALEEYDTSQNQLDAEDSPSPVAQGRLKADILTRIQKAVQDIEPFHISLGADSAGVFSHSKHSKTVWLDPSMGNALASSPIKHLQAALQAEFAECDADNRPFTPHLSVGQAQNDRGASHLSVEINKTISQFLATTSNDASQVEQPAALDWYVDEVYVLERKGFKDRFKVIGTINLGKPQGDSKS